MMLDARGNKLNLGDMVEWGTILEPKRGRVLKLTQKIVLQWDREKKEHVNHLLYSVTVASISDPDAKLGTHKIFLKRIFKPHRLVRVAQSELFV